jgi:polyhydroxybutyrate depolymerase
MPYFDNLSMKSKLSILPLVFFMVAWAGSSPGQEQSGKFQKNSSGRHTVSIKVGNLEREYIVHVPTGYGNSKPVPVVIMCHGGGGTGKAAITETKWNEKADGIGFLAVFPEATRPNMSAPANFRNNGQTWNDGSGRFQAKANDVEFISVMIDDLIAKFNVDPKRIYATGFSNGASMAFRLGVELSQRIAAIAPVAGALWVAQPKVSRPISMLYITGRQDPLNPLNGGMPRILESNTPLGGKAKPPVAEHIAKWIAMLHCPAQPEVVYDRDGIKGVRYAPCDGQAEVLFYTIDGMGHTWPGGFSILPESWVGKLTHKIKANDLIWDFFKRHQLP